MAGAKRYLHKGKIKLTAKAVSKATTKVSLGGEWDFPPGVAWSMEDMWSVDFREGSELQGIRLVRELV